MAGFDNDVIFGSNIDFTGTSPVSGQINLNGELLVGATTAPFIRAYVPTGSNGLVVSTGPGTLDFNLANIPNTALTNSSINVIAGAGLTGGGLVGLGGAVSLALSTPVTVANGGTGRATLTNHGVLVGAATTAITQLAAGSAGQVLQSGGAAADPAYSTATYPATATGTGTILIADGTNWIATTSTYPTTNAVSTLLYASSANVMGALTTANDGLLVTSHTGVPSILAGPGTSRNLLMSNAAAAPSFTTETYAAPGTSGNVMTSDGTNWTSATPAGTKGVFSVLTSTGNPLDGATYFFATGIAFVSFTASGVASTRIYFPLAGTITKCYGAFTVQGTLGSNENGTLNIRLNNTTDTAVSSTIQLTAASNTFNNTGLSISISAGNFIEFKFVSPTWATNPTTVAFSGSILLT